MPTQSLNLLGIWMERSMRRGEQSTRRAATAPPRLRVKHWRGQPALAGPRGHPHSRTESRADLPSHPGLSYSRWTVRTTIRQPDSSASNQ